MNDIEVSGLDLKLARVAARVRQNRLAKEMGVSPTRVAQLERESVITAEMIRRYRLALETCRTSRTGAAA